MTKFDEIAEWLGGDRLETSSAPGTSIIRGKAVSDSSSGNVAVVLGDATTADGTNRLELPTTVSVSSGDEVMVTLVGDKGREPTVTGVVGGGDRYEQHALETYATKTEMTETSRGLDISIQAVSDSVDGVEGTLHDLSDSVSSYGQTIANVDKMFHFGLTGLTIGESSSRFKSRFDNDSLTFTADDQEVLELDAQTSTASASRVSIGKYQWRSIDAGNAMALVYVG